MGWADAILHAVRDLKAQVQLWFMDLGWAQARLEARQRMTQRGITLMAGELAVLTQEVAEIKTVAESAVALLNGLKAKLDEAIASGDPAQLTALSNELDAVGGSLAAAVAANTPAEG
jgi:hypothetical protein